MSIISISGRYLLECGDRARKEKGCVEEGAVVATHCLGESLPIGRNRRCFYEKCPAPTCHRVDAQ